MDWYDSPIGYNFRIRYAVEVDNPRCTESSRLGCIQSQRSSFFFTSSSSLTFFFRFPFSSLVASSSAVVFMEHTWSSDINILRVTLFVSTHVQLFRLVFVYCGGTLMTPVVCLTGWITLGRYLRVKLEACRILEMTIAHGTILQVVWLVLMTFVAWTAWNIAYMLFFVVIAFLALLAEITSI